MLKHLFISCWLIISGMYIANAQTDTTVVKLARMPLANIFIEYPNKTGHTIAAEKDARLTPRELHPAFYGSFDWHSCVHGHWMLARILRDHPQISLRDSIIRTFDISFTQSNMQAEADYFNRPMASLFERTYGWAWLLKLTQELKDLSEKSHDVEIKQKACIWEQNVRILAQKIVDQWKAYLPKQTYPIRIGTHGNSAFGLAFAIDYAQATHDKEFENALIAKAQELYLSDRNIPAQWEPDASDFFSPSLMTADLMTRVLTPKAYALWISRYYTPAGIKRICEAPIVSDLNDYQIVHLVGLCFSRSWCMATIAHHLPAKHRLQSLFLSKANEMYQHGMSMIFRSNYGGDHWLGSFAVYCKAILDRKSVF
ncbi:DUF2891 domain-containing protein [Porphyromonas pogonae]|uniref:DUF2891 domain-containing protein n=1 Tax=Porphyromonas pogonae TaxID=867595 RepID=UPI002E7839D3|nr:DUF2891 domain-containing protein [Porphyromonas pogonae]